MKRNSLFSKAMLLTAGVAFLLSSCGEIRDDISALEGRVDALEGSVATVQEQVAGLQSSVTALKVVDEQLGSNIEALQSADATFQSSMEAVQSEIESLKSADLAINASVETLQKSATEMSGKVSALESGQSALESDVDAVEARLGGIDASIASLNQVTKDNAEDLQELLTKIGTIEGNVTGLGKSLTTVESALDALKKSLDAYASKSEVAELAKALDAAKSAISSEYKKAIEAAKGEMTAAINAAKSELTKTLGAQFESALKGYATLAALEAVNGEVDDLKTEMAKNLDQMRKEYEKAIDDALAAALADDGVITTKIAQMIQEAVNTLNARIELIESDVEDLLARVQSIVYLPDYSDGKITISYASMNSHIVEGYSKISYRVFPAEAATDIATLYGLNPSVLSFNVKGVISRAANPALNVVKAEAADGVLTLTVKAENLGNAFYAGSASYSVALLLNDDNNNRSTEYTNIIAASAANVIDMFILDSEKNDITDTDIADPYKIQYTNVGDEFAVKVLDGHHVAFSIDGGAKRYTSAQMAEMGYDIDVDADIEYVCAPAAKASVFANSVKDGIAIVSLSKQDAEAVEAIQNVKYTYEALGKKVFASANVQITKILGTIALTVEPIVWNYAEDAASDAGADTNSVDAAIITVEGTQLPSDTDYSKVIAATLKETIVKVGTVVDPNVVAVFGGNTDHPNISLSKFEWGKTYTIDATYALPNIDVTISTTIQTVDRKREVLNIALAADQHTLKKDDAFTTAPEELTAVYEGLKDILALGDMTAADFLKDIFVTKALQASSHKENGASLAATMLSIAADGQKISASYDYTDFATEVPSKVDYELSLTTWFGQEIVFTKSVELLLPAYDYKHTDLWVVVDGTNSYSTVVPTYAPSLPTVALASFSVNDVDLNTAFHIVNSNGEMVTDLTAVGLESVFSFKSAPISSSITLVDNVISYNGADDAVNVSARLSIVNSNGSRATLPTQFDADGQYATYHVRKYDPIGSMTATAFEQPVSGGAHTYTFNAMKQISLKDYRGGYAQYDLIKDGAWVVGDGNNGYASGVLPKDMYGFGNITFEFSNIPQEYASVISCNTTTGEITFQNTNEIQLVKIITINVKASVEYTWGKREVLIPCKFYPVK